MEDTRMKGAKMLVKFITFFLILTLFFSLVIGCSYNVAIMTNPEGAKVYVQGMYIGKSPATYRDRSGTPKTYMLKITKPGHKEINTVIDRNYKADISLLWLIPGIIPYFVGTAELEETYNFELERQ